MNIEIKHVYLKIIIKIRRSLRSYISSENVSDNDKGETLGYIIFSIQTHVTFCNIDRNIGTNLIRLDQILRFSEASYKKECKSHDSKAVVEKRSRVTKE